jgi:hypothetical protein
MYAEALFGTPGRIARLLGSNNALFRISVGPSIMMDAPGQFRGLRERNFLNALKISPDEDYKIFADVPTLKICFRHRLLYLMSNFYMQAQILDGYRCLNYVAYGYLSVIHFKKFFRTRTQKYVCVVTYLLLYRTAGDVCGAREEYFRWGYSAPCLRNILRRSAPAASHQLFSCWHLLDFRHKNATFRFVSSRISYNYSKISVRNARCIT